MCVSSQFPSPLEGSGMTWDNKRGWSVPRDLIESAPMLIGVRCLAKLGGKLYQSVSYLFHNTGKNCISVFIPGVLRVQSSLAFQPK